MSDLKINNITNRSGDGGPVIAGVSTVATSAFMIMPSGDTAIRGAGSGRGVFAGRDPSADSIDMIEIASTGNASRFGDLQQFKGHGAPACSATRGMVSGGSAGSPIGSTNVIEKIEIATLGDFVDFGDTQGAGGVPAGASSCTRAVVMGSAFSGSYTNTIEYKQISSSGDMIDFGDLQGVGGSREGASNGHGGLG